MSHFDTVKRVPSGFRVLGATENTAVAVMGDDARRLYGVQFHPEVVHTAQGREILRTSSSISPAVGGLDHRVVHRRARWRPFAGGSASGKVLCALSGGVDSSVAAVLVHRAIGDQLTCIFVDHGLMRKGEPEQVVRTFRDHFHIRLVHVDASDRFLSKLRGVTDPEQKRKIIGNEFIRVFEDEARKLGRIDFLVQGTVYPDVIESGTGTARVIKSHHNVGGLPEDMQFQLIEPFRELFKDEVRAVGPRAGRARGDRRPPSLPRSGPGRAGAGGGHPREAGHPAGGRPIYHRRDPPGRAVRPALAGLRRAAGRAQRRGAGRRADVRLSHRAPGGDLGGRDDRRLSTRCPGRCCSASPAGSCSEVPHVNRVVYDVTSKPPGTIEWE